MDGYTSDGTSSASESSGVDLPVGTVVPLRLAKRKPVSDAPVKKRKTTYYARKDEIQALEDQVRALQAKLQQYERDVPSHKTELRDALVANAVLARAVEQSTLSLAGTQSMMSAHTLAMIRATGVVPLRDVIRLPTDTAQRDAVMGGMYESKLRAAAQFMTERTRFLDLNVAHKQSEQFELPDGELCVLSLDITQFRLGHSIRQVYHALKDFIVNQEITISEKLGFLTVRESEELEEFKFGQSRFLSTVPGGVEVECNIVTFATCVDATAEAPGFAIATMDYVDVDDLHPYRPEICVRKDLTGAVMLTEIPSLTGDKPTIAMTRWSFVRMLPPQFPISEEVANVSRNGITQWCGLIPKIMKEQLSFVTPEP